MRLAAVLLLSHGASISVASARCGPTCRRHLLFWYEKLRGRLQSHLSRVLSTGRVPFIMTPEYKAEKEATISLLGGGGIWEINHVTLIAPVSWMDRWP